MTKAEILDELLKTLTTVMCDVENIQGGTVQDKGLLSLVMGNLEDARRVVAHEYAKEVIHGEKKPVEIPKEEQIF